MSRFAPGGLRTLKLCDSKVADVHGDDHDSIERKEVEVPVAASFRERVGRALGDALDYPCVKPWLFPQGQLDDIFCYGDGDSEPLPPEDVLGLLDALLSWRGLNDVRRTSATLAHTPA